MSMMAGLVFRGEIPDTAALTQAMQELGFPILVIPPHYPLKGHSGYLPMLLRGEQSGAEFYLEHRWPRQHRKDVRARAGHACEVRSEL